MLIFQKLEKYNLRTVVLFYLLYKDIKVDVYYLKTFYSIEHSD